MSARVTLHAEATADPAVVSWVTSLVAIASLQSSGSAGLLAGLAADGRVTEVAVGSGRVDVTAAPGERWRTLGPVVRETLTRELQRAVDQHSRDDDTIRQVAEVVLARYVGDLARSHGGLITIDDVSDGVVTLGREGTCGHCPAAEITVHERFEQALRQHLPSLCGVRSRPRKRSRWGAQADAKTSPSPVTFIATS